MSNAFTEAAAKAGGFDFADVKNFKRFLKLTDPDTNYTGWFAYQTWLESLGIPKSEWCPWWKEHSNKDEGFKPFSAVGEGWGCNCLHDCRKDIERGWSGRRDPITNEVIQDRAKYLYAQCVRHGIKDAAELLEWCNDDVKKAWDGDARPQTTPPSRRALVVAASSIKAKPTSWLIKNLIPRKMLSLFAGMTGIAKSQSAIALAAAVTTGKAFVPGGTACAPSRVVMVVAEDPVAELLVPRLMAAGANLDLIDIVQGVEVTDADGGVTEQLFSLEFAAVDLAALLVEKTDIALIVIDPVNSFVGKIDAHRNNEVRAALMPLVTLADNHNIAVTLVHHTRKDAKFTSVVDMLGGSAAYAELAKMLAFMAPINPAAPEENRFIWETVKQTCGRPGVRFVYEIEERTFSGDDGVVIETSRFNFLADTAAPMSIFEAMAGKGADAAAKSALDDGVEFLRGMLGNGQEVASDIIEKKATAAGHSAHTLRRAREALKVTSRRAGFGPDGVQFWSMPDLRTDEQRAEDAVRDKAAEGKRQAKEEADSVKRYDKAIKDRIARYWLENPGMKRREAAAAVIKAAAAEQASQAKTAE